MENRKNDLGDRMKGYENINRSYLPRRVPAIIRLDGKAFHSFTKGLRRPFDPVLTQAMQQTMKYLCENMQGCVIGYTQSDEITLVLTDYAATNTDAWFNYNIQKMVSIAAAMAALAFDYEFAAAYGKWLEESRDNGQSDLPDFRQLADTYSSKQRCALFDARAFSVPKTEVCNCLIWRQQNAVRTSIESVGRVYFTPRQLNRKKCSEIQEMLWSRRGVNWNDFPTEFKRGSCCSKRRAELSRDGTQVTMKRSRKWVIDHEIPIFIQNRAYIESLL